MLRSRFLLITSLLLAVASQTGCGDDSCGPGNAAADGIAATLPDGKLTFTNLTAGPNNDCPDPAAPAGVISMTIQGTQANGSGRITLCIGRPDLLQTQPLTLGGTDVRIIDLKGDDAGCMYSFDSTRPTTGTVKSSGLCDSGQSSAGFALIVDGAMGMSKDCTTSITQVAATLAGKAAVEATP
jgi:hypothetical protein